MYYEVIDNNKDRWIILLHCICANMHIFDKHIKQLEKKYNILLIDLPGHGKSRDYIGEIGFREVAKEIIKIIEELNIEAFSIWGISLGGVIAKYLLEMSPKNIDKIIFEGPAFGLENKIYNLLFNIFNRVKFILPKKLYLKAFIFLVIPGKSQKKIRSIMYRQLQTANYNTISIWLAKLYDEFKSKDYTLLNKSKVNKVYILGEKDYIFKNATIKNIDKKNNTIIIMGKCGHLCHLEREISL